jgi:hypothetical protein
MKLKDGYMLCPVGDSHIVIATGNASLNLAGLTTLNETAAFIWEQLKEETDEKTVVDAMVREFDVDAETAAKDLAAFVAQMREAGLLV